jgi:hypothetical protein
MRRLAPRAPRGGSMTVPQITPKTVQNTDEAALLRKPNATEVKKNVAAAKVYSFLSPIFLFLVFATRHFRICFRRNLGNRTLSPPQS